MESEAKGVIACILVVALSMTIIVTGIMAVNKLTRRVGNDYLKVKYADCVYDAMYAGKNAPLCESIKGAMVL